MKLQTLLFVFVSILFAMVRASPVQAFEMRSGQMVAIAKGVTINGSIVAGGEAISIDGNVDGDLYCGTQTLSIRGTVTGDVICVGQTITISGQVGGSVRVIGQLIDVSGEVKRNITSAGQTIHIQPEAKIGGEVMTAGQSVVVDGSVRRGMLMAGQTVRLGNTVGGDVTAYAQTVSLGEKAQITGNLTYTSPQEAAQATGAAVIGRVSHQLPKEDKKAESVVKVFPKKHSPISQNAVGSLIFFVIVGVIAALAMPAKIIKGRQHLAVSPLLHIAVGVAVCIFAPMAIILTAITLIGIPISILLGLVFSLAIILSRVYVGAWFGEQLLALVRYKKASLVLQVVVGIIVAFLFYQAPFVGGFFSVLSLFWGLGGVVMTIAQSGKDK